ncbi:MAG: hypothetical protein AAFV88_13530 [Planctomycetota bacterium]
MELGSLTRTLHAGDCIVTPRAEFWVKRGYNVKVTVTAPKTDEISHGIRKVDDRCRAVDQASRPGDLLRGLGSAAMILVGVLAGWCARGSIPSQFHDQRLENRHVALHRVPPASVPPISLTSGVQKQLHADFGQLDERGVVSRQGHAGLVEQVEVRLHGLGVDTDVIDVELPGAIGRVDSFQNRFNDVVRVCSHGSILCEGGERQYRGYRPMELRVHTGEPDHPENPADVVLFALRPSRLGSR